MKNSPTAGERAVRIELVRARAALERQRLLRDIRFVGESLKPANLVRGLMPKSSSKNRTLELVGRGLALTRRYPLLASGASALLSGVGRHNRWWKVAAGALIGWQFFRSVRDDDSIRQDRPVRAPTRPTRRLRGL